MPSRLLPTLPLVLIVMACAGSPSAGPAAAPVSAAQPVASPPAKVEPITFEVFVMSQCPYATQVEQTLTSVAQDLGDALALRFVYIGSVDGDRLTSMHGDAEVTGDLAQVCAQRLAPNRFLAFLDCQNDEPRAVAESWRSCAVALDLDVAALAACVEGPEGHALLAASFAEAQARGALGSPTMALNGKSYEGGRQRGDFLRAFCGAYGDAKPKACLALPAPIRIPVTVFSDARCAECDLERAAGRLQSDIPGAAVRKVDYMTPEGRALYAELKQRDPSLRFLPLIILGKEAKEDADVMAQLGRYLAPLGDDFQLLLGGKFDPTAEICDNEVDDTGDGKADCGDPTCKEAFACRAESPLTLDLFLMSQCPYGARAVTALAGVQAELGPELVIRIHFIGNDTNGELTSMHGAAEVAEDIRQVCAAKLFTKQNQFMTYLSCRAADYRNEDWRACTGQNGIDARAIEKCEKGEGKKLLSREFAVSEQLEIGASPTWMVNNRYKFSGIDGETILANYCRYNPGTSGCGGQARPAPKPSAGACQ